MYFRKKTWSIIFLILAIIIPLFLGNSYNFLIIKNKATIPNFIENFEDEKSSDFKIKTKSNLNQDTINNTSDVLNSPMSTNNNTSNISTTTSSTMTPSSSSPVSIQDLSHDDVKDLLKQYLTSKISNDNNASSPTKSLSTPSSEMFKISTKENKGLSS